MSKDCYVFPAIFHYADDGISVEFLDLPGCFTCADTTEEAMIMAKEALSLHLYGMEEDNEEIPVPSDLTRINTASNERIVLIEVFMPPLRDEMENKAVKKTVTIPKWLNDIAESQKINFSQVLQAGIKQHLGIYSHKPFKKQT